MDPPATPVLHNTNKRAASSEEDTPLNKKTHQDPIIANGYHFMCTVEAFILPSTIIENQCWYVYQKLIEMSPHVNRKLGDPAAFVEVGKLLQQGVSSAKSIDTSSIKAQLPYWWASLAPKSPPIPKNKSARGFHNDITGWLLCPAVLNWDDTDGDWPNFLYMIPYDADMPWVGVFQGLLLVKAFCHVFTSPSSTHTDENISDTGSSTRSGNAQLHGMTKVTTGSIAYIATQVYFALSSHTAFTRNSRALNITTFYNSMVGYLRDPENTSDTKELLWWWDKHIFHSDNVSAQGSGNGSQNTIKAAQAAHREATT
ncbi:hypothetical protein BDN71DRAFT_1501959 [Pleurotus eryngii]|uniref:Uncharacterized protein n=1 Tax=Pleurotus eryngii TaxID=5323 RepID=A0A9P6A686_PLEER|nr:hypothetical protein BDN71DRAFT_1501959 [Pleurotus eryngii]